MSLSLPLGIGVITACRHIDGTTPWSKHFATMAQSRVKNAGSFKT